jgi:predicted transcriptional regulator of viral defense system
MQIQQFIQDKVNRTEPGKLITYQNFSQLYDEYPDAVAKALERLVKKGVLVRQKKGVFYKPEQGRFGALRVKESEILKQLMYVNGRLIGYPSGPEAFRALGISTQVSNTITIATAKARRRTSLNNISIRFIQSKVKTIRRKDIPKLQLLDTLRLIKKGQDISPDEAISKISDILKNYSDQDQKDIVRLAKKYNPRTKALLGAILQDLGLEKIIGPLRNDHNPLTSYNVGLSSEVLPNKDQWAII